MKGRRLACPRTLETEALARGGIEEDIGPRSRILLGLVRMGQEEWMRLKVMLVASVMAVVGVLGTASPAGASRCDDSINEACRVAATVICGVVAKGQPCLN